MKEALTVPRDPNIGNKHVTKDVESYLLDSFSDNPEETFTIKEIQSMVGRKFRSMYGDDLKAHAAWALDMLHYNGLIKRVAPGTFESIDGPDEVYTERETGHAPEGEFSNRGKNTKGIVPIGSRKEFNQEIGKALVSARMLKNMGKDEHQISGLMTHDKFNPVATKIALKQVFNGITFTPDMEDVILTKKGASAPQMPPQ